MIQQKKDIFILTIGKVLQVVISLASIKILTMVLSTQEVGNYYLLLTVLTLFDFVLLNPLGQYYSRYIVSWEKTNNIKNATIVIIFIRLIIILMSLFFAYVVFMYFDYNKYYTLTEFLLFIFIYLFAGTYLVLLSAINILGDRIKFIKYTIIYLILALFFSLMITKIFDKNGLDWLYGIVISELILIVPLFQYLVKNNTFSLKAIKTKITKEFLKKISYFIIPVSITLFLQWGQNISYRFIVESKYSVEILAYIAVGFSVSGAIFNAVDSLANQYFNPIYMRKITNASKKIRAEAWNELASFLIPMYILLAVFIITLSPYLVNILVAQKFHNAYIYTILGAIIELTRVTTNLIYKVSQSELKTHSTIFPYAIGFVLLILILYLNDFTQDLWMIPIVLIISYNIIMVLLYFNMKKLLPISIHHISIGKLLLTMPFFSIYLFDYSESILFSLVIVAVFGIYYLYILYILLQINKKGLKN